MLSTLFTGLYVKMKMASMAASGFIGSIFENVTEGVTKTIKTIVDAIKSIFLNLIYEDPSAEVKVVSEFAIFLFVLLGISVGVGLVWLVLSLIKRRK